ncbi:MULTISPECIES: stage II sporulation protein M [unclassified Bacillus (in: firmicutes)]|uniref:stage II sporulation protein M n=1 Tax=Bacillus TaxID=1386 RepID=UPI00338D9301
MFCLLFPHGLFEIPALLLSGSIGFMSIKMVWDLCFTNREHALKIGVKQITMCAVFVVVLIISAAFVESYLTPFLCCKER